MDQQPVPSIAVYNPGFLPLTTASTQIPRVDRYARWLTDHSPVVPSLQRGECTNAATTGEISYTSLVYTTLDSVALLTGETLLIHGCPSTGDLQGVVELIIKGTTETFLLKSIVTESVPSWPAFFPIPIEVVATEDVDIILRIKALRPNRTGHGSGRIMARMA